LAAWKELINVFKINIDFMQINSSLPSVLGQITWPEIYIDFLANMNFIDMDLLSMTGATCIKGVNFISKFVVISMLPIVVAVFGILEVISGRLQIIRRLATENKALTEEVKKAAKEIFIMIDEDHNHFVEPLEYNDFLECINENPDNTVQPLNEAQFIAKIVSLKKNKQVLKWWWNRKVTSHALNTGVQILLLLYTPVTRKLFQFFNCHTITNDLIFLREDYSVECYKNDWNVASFYVILYTIIFAFGFPATITFYLYWYRKDLRRPNIQARVGFLYDSYAAGSEFWEIHEIFRKVILTGIIIYISVPIVQISMAVLVCTISLVNLNYFQPHKNKSVFLIAQLSFFLTNMKYIVATFLLYRENTISLSDKKALYSYNVDILLIGSDILFFFGSFIASVYAAYTLNQTIKKLKAESFNRLKSSVQKVSSSVKMLKLTAVVPVTDGKTLVKENLSKLKDIRTKHGASSEEYKEALEEVKNDNMLKLEAKRVEKMKPTEKVVGAQ
jgi:biopolymer transport protein ExbB/TolQ